MWRGIAIISKVSLRHTAAVSRPLTSSGVTRSFDSKSYLLIITRIKGINLREVGSGDIGATNVARTGNKCLAALALLLDSLKGFIAVYIAQKFCDNNDFYTHVSAILAVLGHMFLIWLKFKRGKGVSTTLGVLIALNMPVTLIFIFAWIVCYYNNRDIFQSGSIINITNYRSTDFFFNTPEIL
ncbi:glycerol-3-phosphate acyltransferase-like [Calliopsis andreniformis]|uniref:glycerol-3-phosphate acyltransferase-like n=1 Tax=Calliopsis andreniformis TaxID=337506 RepID=UPI003FCDACFB